MQLALTDKKRIVRILLTWTEPPAPPICPVCNKPECRASHEPEPEDTRKKDTRDPEREEKENFNRSKVVELMGLYNIPIPAREFDKWRATVPTTGYIEGIANGLECILTNGLLGYFLRGDREPLYAHVTHFTWDKAKITFVKYIDPDTKEEKLVAVKSKSGAPPPFGSDDDKTTVKTKKLKPKSRRQQIIDDM
jgi:hypothetical protein